MSAGIINFRSYRIKRSGKDVDRWERVRQTGLFDQNKDIIMICAVLGFQNNAFVKIEKAHSDGLLMQFFTDNDVDLINLIAYAHAGNQDILKREEKYEIFESYANGGFEYLWKHLNLPESQEPLSPHEKRALANRYYSLLKDLSVQNESLDTNDEDIFDQIIIQ